MAITAWTELVPRCDGSGSATFSFHCSIGACSSDDVLEAWFWLVRGSDEPQLVGYFIRPEGSVQGLGLYPVSAAAASADSRETGSFWVELPAAALREGDSLKHHAAIRNRDGAEFDTYLIDSDEWPHVLSCPDITPGATPAAAPSPGATTPPVASAAAAEGGNAGDSPMVESQGTATGRSTASGVGTVMMALLAGGLVVAMLWLSALLVMRKYKRRRANYQVADQEEDEFAFAYSEAGDDASPKSLGGGGGGGERIRSLSRSFSKTVGQQRERVLAATGSARGGRAFGGSSHSQHSPTEVNGSGA